ncbi:MAG: aminotransferase class I/II-fold pyridoxal phosphate-dependent enzyme [Ekhidna sp.]|nr:aminotransferase class I/II-fold pyridoxal phosphate-dependent enzyme [Ekhidna sp.]
MLKTYLDETWQMLERQDAREDANTQGVNPKKIKEVIDKSLPSHPQEFKAILQDFEEEIFPFINQNTKPNYGAYITGSGNKIAAIAEFIKGFYNQNGLKWNSSPITSELEQLVIKWIADFCDVPQSKGVLTNSGSMSNFLAVHFALTNRFPEREQNGIRDLPHVSIYCSDQTHSSFERATVFLGLGRKSIKYIPSDEVYQMDLTLLQKAIEEDKSNGIVPLMLVGNAGTTNTGSIDPLGQLHDIAQKNNIWYHVDGAYGLPAKRLSKLAPYYNGTDKADSISVNPHKWMYVPFEASCVLLNKIPNAINFTPDYLTDSAENFKWESSSHTIELSKEFRALKIWFTLKYYGSKSLSGFIEKDIELIEYLAESLSSNPHIRVEATHPLSILCFRYENEKWSEEQNEEINVGAVRTIEQDGKIFITGTKLKGRTYLRVYYGNPERTNVDVDYMVEVILDTFKRALL